MLRRFSILLILFSLVAQVMSGVVPNGRLCTCAPIQEERCGCCAEKQRAAMKERGVCPCPASCPQCETVRLADTRMMPGETPRTASTVNDVSADLSPHTGPAPPVFVTAGPTAPSFPQVNESPPPHLAALSTTVLLL